MERRIVVSTIGTSLLTNPIDRGNPNEKDWQTKLRDAANLNVDELPDDVKVIMETLKERAIAKLDQAKVSDIRRVSAELNGIYGLYDEQILDGKQDVHYLVATDTAQGIMAAEIVQNFLQSKGIPQVNIQSPKGLSTASTENFAAGIDELIVWLREQIEPMRSSYRVCFNLVGSFKSLQGYMNSIGMFYADEIIYIFEGEGSKLIKIPRLPIRVDTTAIAPHAVMLSRIKAGYEPDAKEVAEMPEAMLWEMDGKKLFSTWGELIWEEVKLDLLSQDLLPFPYLVYADTFRSDYKSLKDSKERLKLQEVLARVSVLLDRSNGDLTALKADGGIQYERYVGSDSIDHFRINLAVRVSCRPIGKTLELRFYGTHNHVERSEKI